MGRTAALVALAMAALSCSAGSSEVADPLPGRLLVLGADGNIVTMNPDGSQVVALTDDAAPGRAYLQPTWDPTGERVAWSELTQDDAEASIVVADANGEGRTRAAVDRPPFYYSWSPEGSRLAFLHSQGSGSIAFGILEAGEEAPAALVLDQGRPYYFSWSPDGLRLLTHVGIERLAILERDGARRTLPVTGGRFQAPQWAPGGARLVFAVEPNPDAVSAQGGVLAVQPTTRPQQLVLADTAGETLQRVADFEGVVAFQLAPDGSALAYAVRPHVPAAGAGTLRVTDLAAGTSQEVASGNVLGFQWSPTGALLLVLLAVLGDDGLAVEPRVWDGERSLPFDRFVPTATLATDYLPFWDQYAQSLTLWSPDGAAFAYAALEPDGDVGIWVQRVRDDASPRRVASGRFASWSPG